jgi:hypothetical protein
MKKAQTEMLGIAIVVILISIGILFIVANALKSSTGTEQKREFSEKQLATNILGSILQTSTNCQNDRISTLMMDCGKPSVFRDCPDDDVGGAHIHYQGDVCQYLEDIIAAMLNQTMGKWNKKYQLLAYESQLDIKINVTHRIGECLAGGTGLQYVQKEYYYLPLYPGTMTVEISLCS